ncbi:glycosyltransferase [Sediminibacterium sp.]|uniref:glycosyltransferase n=1 Tax=Sediminibacterium sp. TaxID=1917865 RepID=UPI0027335513|nr:glycosyltransferase [Sediminibacterium sp.]MDP3393998.1 glycosyltransferase [Sediminibacterium sp.]MDP3566773.1 glycosyltransferase [Sediminibacterium sp.]
MQSIVFTVTNDISYDQRMHRICSSLAVNGFQVRIIGVKRRGSIPLPIPPLYHVSYQQQRLNCFFQKGPLFYLEFNIKLFILLCSLSYDTACAIDLDTILPVWLATWLRRKKRVYDAHEYFTEMKEVRTRPMVQTVWKWIERSALPHFKVGYTVNQHLADLFYEQLQIKLEVIRNLPSTQNESINNSQISPEKGAVLAELPIDNSKSSFNFTSNNLLQLLNNQFKSKFIIYQGAVNHGRGFEQLIPAMQWVNAPLLIVGQGNFLAQTTALIEAYGLEQKVFIHPPIPPAELKMLTPLAHIGITIFEAEGVNQFYSLANRFFDYMAAGVPQVCVNYPMYAQIVKANPFALLIDNIEPSTIAAALNNLLSDDVLYNRLQQECSKAAKVLNWENESNQLIAFYSRL